MVIKRNSFSDETRIDFSALDSLLDLVLVSNLAPGLELMGNPSGVFENFKTASELKLWQRIISEMVERYLARYAFNFKKKTLV